MKRWLLIALFIAVAILIGMRDAVPAQATEGVVVKIAPKALLARDGMSARLKVKVRCPAGLEVLEGFAYINQSGNESDFGGLNPVCDGERHKVYVTVNASDTPFTRGQANASAFLLLIDPATQETQQGQDSRIIKLKYKVRYEW
jgi:hypothetical protein